jgi:hypothetical protein
VDHSPVEACCDRCTHHPPPICCDLCDLHAIQLLIPGLNLVQLAIKATCKPKQVKVAPHPRNMTEQSLQHDLDVWRARKARQCFGDIDFFTPNVFLHTYVMLRVINLAHAHKLHTTDDLKNQTSWCFADEYGDELISLVLKHYPIAPPATQNSTSLFISTPLHSRATNANDAATTTSSVLSSTKSRTQPRCGNCGVLGH